jgi:hypothetical protein
VEPVSQRADAFELLIVAIGYFAAIGVASAFGGVWAGLAVFLVLTAVAVLWIVRRGRAEKPVPQEHRRGGGPDEHRVLVIANETVAGRALREQVTHAAEGQRTRVLVVCPALNSPLRHWASDEDGARAAAQERLEASLAELRRAGVDAAGEVGDGDPLQAMEDALRTFGADEVVISTHPEGRSHWLERGVVDAARERFTVPITHVVVDLEAEARERV